MPRLGCLTAVLIRLFCCLAILGLTLVSPGLGHAAVDPHFQPLIKKLARAGFDRAWLENIFDRPCVALNHKVLLLRLTVKESELNYGQFLEDQWITRSREFMKRHAKTLAKAQDDYHVPAEVLVGLLLVETKLGSYIGKHQTLSALATHAAAGQSKVANEVYERLPAEAKKRWTRPKAAKRLADREKWSFNELKAFLRYLRQIQADPCKIYGSYTGAIGLCQFQPSNLKPFGRDGNSDGLVDLFQAEDAIVSAAAYLKKHGWQKKMTQARKIRALRRYNNSMPYAGIILKIADLLEP
ncbi:MAG: lytic murein transglycosylase [Thermodesulfobacteriota bacterium]|nr:lytic murein transglycosylase [Thermodesulfobacteriota bacterium]